MEIGNLALESYFHSQGIRFVAGIDEVGRGPLAGPVVAAACLVFRIVAPSGTPLLEGVRDSKVLTPVARKKIFWRIVTQTPVAVGVVSERKIDRVNILQATRLAMREAVLALPVTPDLLLIDGDVEIDLPIDQVPIFEGDKRVTSIGAASIVAKVTRDEMMMVYDRVYPDYGFRNHKGYATEAHLRVLKERGPSPIHRRSFGPVKESKLIELEF